MFPGLIVPNSNLKTNKTLGINSPIPSVILVNKHGLRVYMEHKYIINIHKFCKQDSFFGTEGVTIKIQELGEMLLC